MKNNILYILTLTLVFFSCKEKPEQKELTVTPVKKEIQRLTNKDKNLLGAFLFSNENDVIANWTEYDDKVDSTILKFAYFDKEKSTFSNPIVVTPSKGLQTHAESMAKVAITKNGVLYAFFRIKPENSRSMFGGILYYATSTDKGQNWSPKKRIVADKKSTSQSFYDVAQLPDGELGLIWLDKRRLHSNFTGQTLYFAKTNSNLELEGEIAIEGSVCQCCRTEIEVDKNNQIHIAFRNIIEPNEDGYPISIKNSKQEIRDMYYITSKDNGKTFSTSITISDDYWFLSGCPHTGPSLANNGTETAAVWFTGANSNPGLFFTTKNSRDFKERQLISVEGRHPQMITLNNKFFIVYEEYYETEGKGYNKILLQKRDLNSATKTIELSDSKTDNSYAVLKQISENQILVSWVNNDTRKSVIEYFVHDITNK